MKRIYALSILMMLAVLPLGAQDQRDLRSRLETLDTRGRGSEAAAPKNRRERCWAETGGEKARVISEQVNNHPQAQIRLPFVRIGRKEFEWILPDQSVKLKLGGRILNDWVAFSADRCRGRKLYFPVGGTEFRTSRLLYVGNDPRSRRVQSSVRFCRQRHADFKDVWIGIKGDPGSRKVSHWPFQRAFWPGVDEQQPVHHLYGTCPNQLH